MPTAVEMSAATHAYRQHTSLLAKSFDGLTADEWNIRPNEACNSMLWIIGHVIWARSMALQLMGAPWTKPWLSLFARGAAIVEPSQYPSSDEILAAWVDVSAALTAALEGTSDAVFSSPAPEKMPSFDGSIGGMVSFLAFHEAYHVGQAAYLRRFLGHSRVIG
jgi:uncharacterized damage-inducible protein DinB